MKLFCKSQSPQKSVILFFLLAMIKDQLTDLWGNLRLQNDFAGVSCSGEKMPSLVRSQLFIQHLKLSEAQNLSVEAVLRSSSEEGWYLRRIDFCITQL